MTDDESPPGLALLIAQEIYRTGSGLARLTTPVAGALALADELENCGFDVTLVGDDPNRTEPMTIADLRASVEQFAERAEAVSNATVFFYFAGHGVAHGDDYFMLSETTTLQTLRADGLDLSWVARRLDRQDHGLTIIVSDACRDHPFPIESERLRRGLPIAGMEEILQRRALKLDRGLVAISAADGDIVFDDSDGIGMSLFTAKLIEALRRPGDPVSTVFLRTREAVSAATNRRQQPSIVAFNGTLDVVLNRTPASQGKTEQRRALQSRDTKPWAAHKGPIVTIVPAGHDSGVRRERTIHLSLTKPSGWSLNPLASLTGEKVRRGDIAATYAEILLPGTPAHIPIAEERQARAMLATTLRLLAVFRLSIFRMESLADITRLDQVWRYLCDSSGASKPGTVLDDPVMTFAMMADRLAAVSAQKLPEFEELTFFLEQDADKQALAKRDRVAALAVRPFRDFQADAFRRALSPGNVDLDDVLRDPSVNVVIEHDSQSAPSALAATGLWLAAIRAAADVIPSRPPLMIAVPHSGAWAGLPFQRSTADIV